MSKSSEKMAVDALKAFADAIILKAERRVYGDMHEVDLAEIELDAAISSVLDTIAWHVEELKDERKRDREMGW